MKRKRVVILAGCFLVSVIFIMTLFIMRKITFNIERDSAEQILLELDKYIKKDKNNDLFDGTTDVLPQLKIEDEKLRNGRIVVTEHGATSLCLHYDKTCIYKDFNDQNIVQTTDQKKCDNYALDYRQTKSMYSWNAEALSNSKEILNILKELKVNALYQNIDSDNLQEKYIANIIKNYNDEGIAVYRLIGDEDWTYDITKPKEMIEEIIEYNKNVNSRAAIKGVVIDIEPHGTEKWKDGDDADKQKIFKNYVSNMITLYELAHDANLEVVLCTNNWFSNYDDFERLYAQAADVFSIMNYDRRYSIDNIKEELEIAKKYHKRVETIAHSGAKTEDNSDFESYHNSSFETLVNDQNKILKEYPYEYFRASYHYLPSINYLKNKTVFLSIYFETDDGKTPHDLYLTDENGKRQRGTLVSLANDQFFFANIIENHQYQVSSSNYDVVSASTITIEEIGNGRKTIQVILGRDHKKPQVGDYVAYPYLYQNVEDDWNSISSLEGWRILSIEGDEVKLISAGTPELYVFESDPSAAISQIEKKMDKYFLDDYALKVESLDKDMIDQFCNCDSENSSNIKKSIINNGSNVLLTTEYNDKKIYLLENTGDVYGISKSSKRFGLRPVITISKKQLLKQNANHQWLLSKLS